jgi:lysophospholipase L1-like esterase
MIHYLALGDSYTIGEAVPSSQNFPNQLAAMFGAAGIEIETTIIAKTGWTTDELATGIVNARPLRSKYDLVSLLIGVNDQYRGRPVELYEPVFRELLEEALAFAGGVRERVFVVSIPDWGVTPFAKDRDAEKIAKEIDAYNMVNKKIAGELGISYFDITHFTREAANDLSLVTSDGLHPSARDYERWAKLIFPVLSVHF